MSPYAVNMQYKALISINHSVIYFHNNTILILMAIMIKMQTTDCHSDDIVHTLHYHANLPSKYIPLNHIVIVYYSSQKFKNELPFLYKAKSYSFEQKYLLVNCSLSNPLCLDSIIITVRCIHTYIIIILWYKYSIFFASVLLSDVYSNTSSYLSHLETLSTE